MSGSIYGAGPYGQGRYSQVGIVDSDLPIIAQSAIQLSAIQVPITIGSVKAAGWGSLQMSGAIIRVSMHAVLTPTNVQIGGQQLWAPIDVPACEPWFIIAQPACFRALPNSVGNMFPAMP